MKTITFASFFGYALAEASTGPVSGLDFWGELIKAGGIISICAFVLIRLEPRLRGVEAAIDRLNRTITMMFSALPYVLEAVKSQCVGMIKELDAAALKRGEKPE